VLVECIEHGLELHVRHLGEHPDVFDVATEGSWLPARSAIAVARLTAPFAATFACSMTSRCWERAVNTRSRADCMASPIKESANCWAWLRTLTASSVT
jgi:hypothetical protein